MYFNFEENHPDTPRLASSLSVLERVLLTTVFYLLVVILALVLPKTEWYKAQLLAKEQERAELLQQQVQQQQESPRFVYVAPRVEMRAEPPPRAELSDLDRRANSPERAPKPENAMPFSRGNSPERIDEPAGPRERPEPASPPPAAGEPEATKPATPLPESPKAANARSPESDKPRGFATGVISDAIRNVQKYGGGEKFQNLKGATPDQNHPYIQFDNKGVDFGPWLRRFVAQIRSNWFIPYAAMSMKGHVVVTFNVHRDGRITDLQVLKPASVDAFTHSAHNAIAASNPTLALPPEYPDSKAFFTVTFYFNETPDK